MKLIKINSKDGIDFADKIIGNIDKDCLSESGILPLFDVEAVKLENLYEKAKDILKNNTRPLFLGRNHSITLPIVKAFEEVYPSNPGIIIFDAHPDANNKLMPAGQDDLLVGLVNQGIIKKENIIMAGTRAWTKEEFDFIQKNKIKYFSMKEIVSEGIKEVSESLMIAARNFSDLYVSIDIDVLDPAFVSVDCNEPGGLTTRELLFFLHRLKKMHNLRAFDLSEINPEKDKDDLTSKVGAKILVEMC
ncbi:MAG: arginase family protein [Nanoarchaeota archaeon]|nr:arginase family protein [Nanoarchaeota archaeon]MBU1004894.1 arginase family protein [Nanoarchaeota archaeon]MBU1945395.1 arginase family protein [Nanoarchaeota archaeon]